MFLVAEFIALAWILIAMPELATNIKRAWEETQRMQAGAFLTTFYLLSAFVIGLRRETDLQPQ